MSEGRASLCAARVTFAARWVRDTVRGWWLCERNGDHSWTYDDIEHPFCDVCGMPGSVICDA